MMTVLRDQILPKQFLADEYPTMMDEFPSGFNDKYRLYIAPFEHFKCNIKSVHKQALCQDIVPSNNVFIIAGVEIGVNLEVLIRMTKLSPSEILRRICLTLVY